MILFCPWSPYVNSRRWNSGEPMNLFCRAGLHLWSRWRFSDRSGSPFPVERCRWCGRGRKLIDPEEGRYDHFPADLMDRAESEIEEQDALGPLDLSAHDPETLARWSCELNCWCWPLDFPLRKPAMWDGLSNFWKSDLGIMAKAVNAIKAAIPQADVLAYWRTHHVPETLSHPDPSEIGTTDHGQRTTEPCP